MNEQAGDDRENSHVWRNPLSVWGAKGGNYEVPSIRVPDPRTSWKENRGYKVRTGRIGRLKHYVIWPANGARNWRRWRWWPTRRNLLNIRGLYNRKTLKAEKKMIEGSIPTANTTP